MKRSTATPASREAAMRELEELLAPLTPHEKDLIIACPARKCGARSLQECRGLERGCVHFARRLKRLLRGIR